MQVPIHYSALILSKIRKFLFTWDQIEMISLCEDIQYDGTHACVVSLDGVKHLVTVQPLKGAKTKKVRPRWTSLN